MCVWEGETECLHSLILRVCAGMGDLYQLILHMCLGRGHALSFTLCVGRGDRVLALINTTCVRGNGPINTT